MTKIQRLIVEALENDEIPAAEFDGNRTRWLTVCASLANLLEDEDEAVEIWMEWSQGGASYDPRRIERDAREALNMSANSPGIIINIAKEYGIL